MTETNETPAAEPRPELPRLTYEAAQLLAQRFPTTDDFDTLGVDVLASVVLHHGIHETIGMLSGVLNNIAKGYDAQPADEANREAVIALRATAHMLGNLVGVMPDPLADEDEEA